MSHAHSVLMFVHLLGFATVAGAVLCDAVVNVLFWRNMRRAAVHVVALPSAMTLIGSVASTGGLISLSSGIGLIAPLGFAFWRHCWLDLKIGLFIALTLNGVLVASGCKRRLAVAARDWAALAPVNAAASDLFSAEMRRLQRQLGAFHATEVLGVLVLLAAAVFKYD